MEQVDKVAHAIMKAHEGLQSNDMPILYDHLAEQAIMAMRHPTDEMLEVVAELPIQHNRLDMWCAMVDVALGRIKLSQGEEDGEERG